MLAHEIINNLQFVRSLISKLTQIRTLSLLYFARSSHYPHVWSCTYQNQLEHFSYFLQISISICEEDQNMYQFSPVMQIVELVSAKQ